MTSNERYPINVFWSDDDEGFIALAPDLPGCSAFGETRDEALKEIRDAIEAWLGAARAAGNPIPAPSAQQPDYTHSGKVLVRMPKALHAQLAERAKVEGVSLNSWMVFVLTRGIVEANTEAAHIVRCLNYRRSTVVEKAVSSAPDPLMSTDRNWRRFIFAADTSQALPKLASIPIQNIMETEATFYDSWDSRSSEN